MNSARYTLSTTLHLPFREKLYTISELSRWAIPEILDNTLNEGRDSR